ncbi:hypothetical protein QVD17_21295 [Tagetes erecta]|uniref:Uncharacterized protein n=1 Tax=Tagetes erecta TaxID=13708 RepID=A0AAD8KMR3_TARER|nr:hypothetical protein QVD17_21295 [Tagetes erecta]
MRKTEEMKKKKWKSVEIDENTKTKTKGVFTVYLNRPATSNALSLDFFTEFPEAISYLDQNPNVAVIILSATGKHFCAGIDLNSLRRLLVTSTSSDECEKLGRQIKLMQEAISAIEKCRKPVIACVHGACIGAGVDLITACDIRYCTQDAFFSVKEVDLGITADLGSLQRLPSIVGYANAIELALTARTFSASQAANLGLVSKAFPCKSDMDQAVKAIAQGIAAKSPLALIGTKKVLLKTRDHMTLDEALDYVATWNSAMLLSNHDLQKALSQKPNPKL